ncbi:MAG: hypothetical protein UT97_C0013G0001, partial [Parcubacteria group bacterium GW2011_GWC2_40_31]
MNKSIEVELKFKIDDEDISRTKMNIDVIFSE